ncbi:MAG: PTS sugar transporter subunit IIB [Dethiobacteria bacterium]
MKRVKILVVCGSGVATSMHAAYKLREYLEKENLNVSIDGCGNNELPYRAESYDIIVSNAQVTVDLGKSVFSAVPLLTGIGEKELVQQIADTVRKIGTDGQNSNNK